MVENIDKQINYSFSSIKPYVQVNIAVDEQKSACAQAQHLIDELGS